MYPMLFDDHKPATVQNAPGKFSVICERDVDGCLHSPVQARQAEADISRTPVEGSRLSVHRSGARTMISLRPPETTRL